MFEIDEISHLLKVDTDLTIAEIEKRLNPLGFTLGYFSPPNNEILLEEALSHHRVNAYGLLYGSLSELCVALQWETHHEEVMSTKIVPRKATGPDWKGMILGTGRKLGLIYQAVLKIFPHPLHLAHTLISLSTLEDSFPLEREMTRKELIPRSFARYSKAEGGRKLPLKGDFFLLLEWAGSADRVRSLRHEAETILRRKKQPFQTLEDPQHLRMASKLLKLTLPQRPWGGGVALKEDPEAKNLEKEILEVLR